MAAPPDMGREGGEARQQEGLFGRALTPLKMAPALASLEELKPFWKTFGKTAPSH